MKKYVFIILLILVAVFLWFKSNRVESVDQLNNSKAQQNAVANLTQTNSETQNSQTNTLATPDKEIMRPVAVADENSQKVFESFMDYESAHLEDTVQDTEETAKKYQAQSKVLSANQISELAQNVINPNTEIKRRVLSVYLLTQNYSEESTAALKAITFSNDTYKYRPTAPHTMDEILQNQNTTLYNLAVEEWVNRSLKSASDPTAFIRQLKQTATDDRLKKYLNFKYPNI